MKIPVFNFREPVPDKKKKGNKIIVLATQKGGVGKSTVGIFVANHFTDKGIPIHVIDADPQHSIVYKHKEDMKEHPDIKPLYSVYPFDDLDNEEKTMALIADMRKQDNDFIIDTPGNLSLQGMIPLILEADYIIAPFQYEDTCLESLSDFINLNIKVSNNAGREKPTKMIFVPNLHQKTWGTKVEVEKAKAYERSLNGIGIVSPKIPASPELRRHSTLYTTIAQRNLTSPCTNFIHSTIYKD